MCVKEFLYQQENYDLRLTWIGMCDALADRSDPSKDRKIN